MLFGSDPILRNPIFQVDRSLSALVAHNKIVKQLADYRARKSYRGIRDSPGDRVDPVLRSVGSYAGFYFQCALVEERHTSWPGNSRVFPPNHKSAEHCTYISY